MCSKTAAQAIIIVLLFNAIISVAEMILFLSNSIISIKFLPYYLSFYLFGNLILYHIMKAGQLITLFSLVNVFGLLYTNFYITQSIITGSLLSENNLMAMNCSYLAMLSFDSAYLLISKKITFSSQKRNTNHNTALFRFMLLCFCLLSVWVEFYVIFRGIGFSTYFHASRASKSLLRSRYSFLSFYTISMPLISTISLYQYEKHGGKFYKNLFAISFCISIFNAIMSASRAELMSLVIPIVYLLEKNKKISKTRLIIIVVGLFLLCGMWKGLFYIKKDYSLYYDSEFNTWYRIFSNVLDSNPRLLFGKSYGDTLLNLVLPFTNSEPLSVWYVKTFEHDVWVRGGGRGFSGVLEAYINFGTIGIIMAYGFYGWIFKNMQLSSDTGDDFSNMAYMIFLLSIFQLFRSESYSLWKNMMWFRIYPLAIMLWLSQHIEIIASRKMRLSLWTL